VYSINSPGWHCSAAQIASSVEKRIARALPVFKIDRFGTVIPISAASSVIVIRRACNSSSSRMRIAISHGPIELVAHAGPFGEDLREDEEQQDRDPRRE
jgi:hypothetical protein